MENRFPDVVYHYTSLGAMMSILSSRQIWATSILFLNDVSERRLLIEAAEPFLQARIERLAKNITVDDQKHELALPEQLPFVASFSADGNMLTQWRTYCPPNSGVCVGFRSSSLKQARNAVLTEQSWRSFQAVTYVDTGETTFAEKAVGEVWTSTIDASVGDPSRLSQIPAIARKQIEIDASFYKDDSFASEKEYRLAVEIPRPSISELKYRASQSTLVPYVPLDVPSCIVERRISRWDYETRSYVYERERKGWNAVDHIVIGPSPNAALTRIAVTQFCRSLELDIDVYDCGLPYRGW